MHPLAQRVVALCATDLSRFFAHYSIELKMSSPQLPWNAQRASSQEHGSQAAHSAMRAVNVVQETHWRAIMKAVDIVPLHVPQHVAVELFQLCATCFPPQTASALIRGDEHGLLTSLSAHKLAVRSVDQVWPALSQASASCWSQPASQVHAGNEALDEAQVVVAICGLAILGVGNDRLLAPSAMLSPSNPGWGDSYVRLQTARHSPLKLFKGVLCHLNGTTSLFPTALTIGSSNTPSSGRRRQLSAKRTSRLDVPASKDQTRETPPKAANPPVIRGGVQRQFDMGVYVAGTRKTSPQHPPSAVDLFDKVQGAVQRAENILHAAKLRQGDDYHVAPNETSMGHHEIQLHQERMSADQWVLAGLGGQPAIIPPAVPVQSVPHSGNAVKVGSPNAAKRAPSHSKSPARPKSKGSTPRTLKSIKPKMAAAVAATAPGSSKSSVNHAGGSRASSAQRTGEQSQQQFNPVMQLTLDTAPATGVQPATTDKGSEASQQQLAGPAARKAGAAASDKLPVEVWADPSQAEWQEVEVEAMLWNDYAEIESVDSEAFDWAALELPAPH